MDAQTPRQRFTDLAHLALSFRLGSFSGEMLGWGFFEPKWWRNYLHTHSFFEVCYIFQGRGTFRILGHDYSVQEGEVFVARPGEVHEIVSSQDNPMGIYFWSYTLIAHGEQISEAKGVDALLNAFLRSRRPVGAPTLAMQRTLELLTEEVVRKEPGYSEVIKGLVVKLLLDTARAVVEMPAQVEHAEPRARSPEEAIVQMIVRYLRDNYSREVSVRDLAAQVHLSERHTGRLFHKIMGVSIKEYLTALRLETASQLLIERQLPIKEVAQAVGYPDVRYFTTLFRQHTGLTPAVFRHKGGTRFLNRS